MATGPATWEYRDRFHESFGRTYFRRYGDGVVSSIGLGTYLGDPTDEVDDRYSDAIHTALDSGINVLDTAINYRCQRSERVVGRAMDATDVDREAVLVATKGGFVPFDGARPDDPGQFIREEYIDTGLIDPGELVAGSHCLAPEFIDDQFERSRENLRLDTIDLYYVHNPETQLRERSAEAVYDRLESTFEILERKVDEGRLRAYGIATWKCFRVDPDADAYLSLPEVISRARSAAATAGNDTTGFRAIQLPFNVRMADAFTVEGQEGPDGHQSVLSFAHDAGLSVFTSASIMQGDLATEIPDGIAARLDGETTVQRAINFARSAPGVTSSLVGMSRPEHVEENVAAGTDDPLGASAFDAVFE